MVVWKSLADIEYFKLDIIDMLKSKHHLKLDVQLMGLLLFNETLQMFNLEFFYILGPGHYEDAIVCCVRENPEPIVFKLCCDGFRPELELDKKQLHFDRVLLHR